MRSANEWTVGIAMNMAIAQSSGDDDKVVTALFDAVRAIQRDAIEAAAAECADTNPAVFAAGERILRLKDSL